MSWLNELAKTYDYCAGKTFAFPFPLIPLFHKSQNSHLCIKLDAEGNFIEALPGLLHEIIIPCTERSAAKANGINPHPLEDNLQYIAGDLSDYTEENYTKFHDAYLNLLTEWKDNDFSHPKVRAIYLYISKNTLIQDLVQAGILSINESGKLVETGDLPLYKATPGSVTKALVRFSVVESGENANPVSECWLDESLYKSWSDFFKTKLDKKGFCYATGTDTFLATTHPKYIRNSGDGGKLISSNDDKNFTFRGLFKDSEEAVGVSIELSQKAHLALKWLISNQAFVSGDLVYVFWAPAQPGEMPSLESDLINDLYDSTEDRPTTGQEYAVAVSKMVAGYKTKLSDTTHKMNVLGLNSATTGRISIIYYREMDIDSYLSRLADWYNGCCWTFGYFYETETPGKKGKTSKTKHYKDAIGTPIFREMIQAAYGSDYSKINDKLKEKTIERLIHCVVDGDNMPFDLVQSAFNRILRPDSFRNDTDWIKNMAVTCAMYKKHFYKENYGMALNEDRVTRDYLFGRLLAVADSIESWALNKSGESRETAAVRYFSRFAAMPLSAWKTIELSLQPYIQRLGVQVQKRQKLIDNIFSKFKDEDINDAPLGGEFLVGFHHQRQFFEDLKNTNKNTEE